jgi:Family of unknown function (DUF6152)
VVARTLWRAFNLNSVYNCAGELSRGGRLRIPHRTKNLFVHGTLRGKPFRGALVGLGAALLGASATAWAHHSYAMFDMSQPRTVNGTVAKIEWVNPHVFIWLYAKKQGQQSGYDLYAFENGPIGTMAHFGWTKQAFKIGERVTVEYFPLKDGRTGGYFVKATRADGTVRVGDAYLPFVGRELAKDPAAQKIISH